MYIAVWPSCRHIAHEKAFGRVRGFICKQCPVCLRLSDFFFVVVRLFECVIELHG